MKKLLLALIPLLMLSGCGNQLTVYDYEPSLPDYSVFVYGTITDKDDWEETIRRSIIRGGNYIYHYYALIVDETSSDNSYHILVYKALYESVNVGDEIGIVYGGAL